MFIGDFQSTGMSQNSSNVFGSQSQVGVTWPNSNTSVSASVGFGGGGGGPFGKNSGPSAFATGSSTGGFGFTCPAFGSSTSPTTSAPIPVFGSTLFLSSSSMQSSSSSTFGFQPQKGSFGQSSGSFAPRPFGTTNNIATLSSPTTIAGNYSTGFGPFSSALLSQAQSPFIASPAPGSSASSISSPPFSAFASPSLFSSGRCCSQIGPFSQANNSSNTFFGPGSARSTNLFSTSSGPSASSSHMLSGFQAPATSIFSSSPALESSPLKTITASCSGFGPSLVSSGSSVFSSNAGSLFQQTQSSLANQISASTVFGPSNQSKFANNGAVFCDMHTSVPHASPCAAGLVPSSTPLPRFTISTTSASEPSLTTFKFEKSNGHESPNLNPSQPPNFTFAKSFTSGPEKPTSTVKTVSFYPSADKCQNRETGVAHYVGTPEVNDTVATQTSAKFVSISAMPAYEDKSHEELRLEDYQLSWEKGSSVFKNNSRSPFKQTQSTSTNSFGPFTGFGPAIRSTFFNSEFPFSGVDNSLSHGFKCSKCSDCSATPSFRFTPTFCSHAAASGSNNAIGQNITSTFSNKEFPPTAIKCQGQGSRVASYAATPEVSDNVTTTTSEKIVSISAMPVYEHKSHEELRLEDHQLTGGKGCCISKNQFEAGLSSITSNLASSPNISISILPSGTAGLIPGINNNMPVSSMKHQAFQPSVGIINNLSESTFIRNQLNMPTAASNGPGFQSSIAPLCQKTQTTFTYNAAPIRISNQPSADSSSGVGSQNVNMQQSGSQSNLTIGWTPVTNPFGAEPPALQISLDCPVSTTTIQYGISCLSVNDNPAPIRRLSRPLSARHLYLSRNRQTVDKYKPGSNHKKVPFYEEGLPGAYKFKSPFIPRENPRALLTSPTDKQFTETKSSKSSVMEEKSTGLHDTATGRCTNG